MIYTRADLTHLLNRAKDDRLIARRTTINQFIYEMLQTNALQKILLHSTGYSTITRYVCGSVTPYQLALSLKPGSYLSHGTAAFLHGLSAEASQTIYVNKEQSPKPPPHAEPTQAAIDRAFANRQRTSRFEFVHKEHRYVLLSGKHTGRLEVHSVLGPSGETLHATLLERTLIDITVRPGYAGGVPQVLAVYKAARDRVSIKKLLRTLQKLAYRYPYHQAIGFYLKRAGYPETDIALLKRLPVQFDFYLDYNMTAMAHDQEWRVFFPRDL